MLTYVRREEFIEKTVACVQITIMGDRYDGMYL